MPIGNGVPRATVLTERTRLRKILSTLVLESPNRMNRTPKRQLRSQDSRDRTKPRDGGKASKQGSMEEEHCRKWCGRYGSGEQVTSLWLSDGWGDLTCPSDIGREFGDCSQQDYELTSTIIRLLCRPHILAERSVLMRKQITKM
jgi:hypothetical protein